MVTVKLMGGLGNQMFQYAIGRSLAHDLGEELNLDVSFYDRIHANATPRHYELNRLRIQGEVLQRGFFSRYWIYILELLTKKCPVFSSIMSWRKNVITTLLFWKEERIYIWMVIGSVKNISCITKISFVRIFR